MTAPANDAWEPWGETAATRAEMLHAPWPSADNGDEQAVILFVQNRPRGLRKAHVVVPEGAQRTIEAEVMMASALVEHAELLGEHLDVDTVLTETLRDAYAPGYHIVRATARVVVPEASAADLAFYEWALVLDMPEGHPLRTARVEVDGRGVRSYNAEGMLTMEVTNPPEEPRAPRPRMSRREWAAPYLWTALILAIIGGIITGIVLLTQWDHRHARRQTDSAITACTVGGGHYLYAGNQITRLVWTVSGLPNYGRDDLPKPYQTHRDYVVTVVPHTGGGMCLTPEGDVASP